MAAPVAKLAGIRKEISAVEKQTTGIVISVKKQWWLKINTKPVRLHAMDGAIFPHIIRVKYTVDGKDYFRRKWLSAGQPVPPVGSAVTLLYRTDNPAKSKIE